MNIETDSQDSPDHRLKLRNLRLDDFADIKHIMDTVYPGMGGVWPQKKYNAMLKTFPEGQICIEDNDRVVAAAFAVIVDYDKFGDNHTYDEITGNAYLTTHDPNGDVLYGVDIFADPEYRDMRLGRRLYEARKELCRNLNLRAIVAGGRIPFYKKYADKLSPQEYIQEVKRKELYDPILTFQLNNDFEVKRVVTFNAYGDETRIELINSRFDTIPADHLFTFTIPEGADVLTMDQ